MESPKPEYELIAKNWVPSDKVGDVIQLRFKDKENNLHTLPAYELAQTLEGIAGFADEMAKAGVFGEGIPPVVLVRPPHEGSFVIDLIMQSVDFINSDGVDGVVDAISRVGLFGMTIYTGLNLVKGREITDFEYLANGNVKVTWPNKRVDEIPKEAWEELAKQKKKTRKNLEKILAPLSDEADILEVREGTTSSDTEDIMDTEPIEVFDTDDYHEVINAPVPEDTFEHDFETEARFQSMDFRLGSKWKVLSPDGNRFATMDDPEFQLELDRGLQLGKDDIFRINIHETIKTVAGRSTREWSMTRVVRVRAMGGEPIEQR